MQRVNIRSAKSVDIPKIRRALAIKSIAESIPVIGGGIALIALQYSLWGVSCMAAGLFGILAKTAAKNAPKRGRALSVMKSVLEIFTLIAGALTLILCGQTAGGIACISVCATKIAEDVFIMPWVEKKYLCLDGAK